MDLQIILLLSIISFSNAVPLNLSPYDDSLDESYDSFRSLRSSGGDSDFSDDGAKNDFSNLDYDYGEYEDRERRADNIQGIENMLSALEPEHDDVEVGDSENDNVDVNRNGRNVEDEDYDDEDYSDDDYDDDEEDYDDDDTYDDYGEDNDDEDDEDYGFDYDDEMVRRSIGYDDSFRLREKRAVTNSTKSNATTAVTAKKTKQGQAGPPCKSTRSLSDSGIFDFDDADFDDYVDDDDAFDLARLKRELEAYYDADEDDFEDEGEEKRDITGDAEDFDDEDDEDNDEMDDYDFDDYNDEYDDEYDDDYDRKRREVEDEFDDDFEFDEDDDLEAADEDEAFSRERRNTYDYFDEDYEDEDIDDEDEDLMRDRRTVDVDDDEDDDDDDDDTDDNMYDYDDEDADYTDDYIGLKKRNNNEGGYEDISKDDYDMYNSNFETEDAIQKREADEKEVSSKDTEKVEDSAGHTENTTNKAPDLTEIHVTEPVNFEIKETGPKPQINIASNNITDKTNKSEANRPHIDNLTNTSNVKENLPRNSNGSFTDKASNSTKTLETLSKTAQVLEAYTTAAYALSANYTNESGTVHKYLPREQKPVYKPMGGEPTGPIAQKQTLDKEYGPLFSTDPKDYFSDYFDADDTWV